jgi:hypothetical protein
MSERNDTPVDEFETRGPGHKKAGHPRLSSHTPVRFDPETIAAIRQFSDEDGVTVSAWVRRVVRREIQRRISLRTRTTSSRSVILTYEHRSPRSTTSASVGIYSELRAAV